MQFTILGSGSKGNAVYVESGKTGLLIDAGFSGKELVKRLQMVNRDLASVKGICITHEHNDHIKGVGVISRRAALPVYGNEATLDVVQPQVGKLTDIHAIENGKPFVINGLEVRAFSLSHDCVDPVGYIISDGKSSLGYCTDTGKITHLMAQRLGVCDSLVLEFNHNLEMLKNGPYPLPLQQRVRSNKGHLSNEDAAAFLGHLTDGRLQAVFLAHLSEVNNTPVLAMAAANQVLAAHNNDELQLHMTHQHKPTEMYKV